VTPIEGSAVLPLAVSPEYALDQVVFVGVGGRVLKPLRQAQEIVAGERRPIWRGPALPGDSVAVTALAVSPDYCRDRTLFAATSAGPAVSRDGGTSFSAWSEGLGPAPVVALALSPAYARDRLVYALGLGGTVWRRRDE
jgi:hypothetical protein